MTNQAQSPLEPRLALMSMEQLAILVTFRTGVKYGFTLLEIAKRYHEESRSEDAKLAWHAFQNELQVGGTFASALAATGFFSYDVQRILNILADVEPAAEAAVAYLSAVTPHKSERTRLNI
ncbi:hypothetical protein ACYSUW_14665 [Pseudomonas frederiksbergensis]